MNDKKDQEQQEQEDKELHEFVNHFFNDNPFNRIVMNRLAQIDKEPVNLFDGVIVILDMLEEEAQGEEEDKQE